MPWFIAPPLQQFYAQTNADDFNPLKPAVQADGMATAVLRTIAPPVGIAGIAWWRQVEVYLEPAPAYKDYSISWNAQVIVQVTPPAQTAVYNTILLSIPGGMFSIPGDPPS